MPRRREARALIGEYAGQVGRIEALGVKNVQIGACDVLISFGHHATGINSPISAHAFEPGEWERITPPLVRTQEQKDRDRESHRRWEAGRRAAGWRKQHRGWAEPRAT